MMRAPGSLLDDQRGWPPARPARHAQVHQGDVGPAADVGCDRLAAVGRLGHHLHVVLLVDQVAQSHPEDGVVVGDQHADAIGVQTWARRRHGSRAVARPPRRWFPGPGRCARPRRAPICCGALAQAGQAEVAAGLGAAARVPGRSPRRRPGWSASPPRGGSPGARRTRDAPAWALALRSASWAMRNSSSSTAWGRWRGVPSTSTSQTGGTALELPAGEPRPAPGPDRPPAPRRRAGPTPPGGSPPGSGTTVSCSSLQLALRTAPGRRARCVADGVQLQADAGHPLQERVVQLARHPAALGEHADVVGAQPGHPQPVDAAGRWAATPARTAHRTRAGA